jgi:hypothetical protein
LLRTPVLTLGLDPATDSGQPGDNLTNVSKVNLVGTALPNQQVLLDLGSGKFTDGSVTADASGNFVFPNLSLKDGANKISAETVNPQGNLVVTHTFTLDTTAPTVVGETINNGQAQRSMVTTISIQFSKDVSASLAAANALLLQNLTVGNTVASTDLQLSYDAKTNTATWTLPNLTGGSLPDGNYVATVLAQSVTDAAGNILQTSGAGQTGSKYTFQFFRYYGDIDGDRDVDFYDLYQFQQTYLKNSSNPNYNAALDYNGDGDVDFGDLSYYRAHYETVLAPPAAPGPSNAPGLGLGARPAAHVKVDGKSIEVRNAPGFNPQHLEAPPRSAALALHVSDRLRVSLAHATTVQTNNSGQLSLGSDGSFSPGKTMLTTVSWVNGSAANDQATPSTRAASGPDDGLASEQFEGEHSHPKLACQLPLAEVAPWAIGRPAAHSMTGMDDYFRATGVLALASLAKGAACSTLEGLASGTPLVATLRDPKTLAEEFLWIANRRSRGSVPHARS